MGAMTEASDCIILLLLRQLKLNFPHGGTLSSSADILRGLSSKSSVLSRAGNQPALGVDYMAPRPGCLS